MAKENLFRYNDAGERNRRMNGAFIISANCLWAMFLVYLGVKMFTKSISLTTAYANIGLVVVFFLLNLVLFLTDRNGIRLRQAVAVEMGLEFLLLGLQTDAEFLYFALIGILVLQIPYYDRRSFNRCCIFYTVMLTAVVAVRFWKMSGFGDADGLCRVICVYLMIFLLYRIGGIVRLFNDHALGAVAQQSGKQQTILDGVIGISRTVQEESEKSSSLVDELVRATESVAQSMQEITSATGTTADNIEEQNNMTKSIQDAIGETVERSGRMVGIATGSSQSIRENMQVMDDLKSQSEQIAETNREVTESMGRLQDKTKEVEEIAGMILNISSQTNLLALNASIESARAGEAGRGFAVVAEQIRQLAEQTRSSTEQITRIVSELNMNADEVVKSIETSVDAAADQNRKILTVADSFEKLGGDMAQLIEGIGEIDQQITGLSDANNRIVENIAHLSAATEEVTASAEQVREMSEQNLSYAEDVRGAIGMIRESTDSMHQYF